MYSGLFMALRWDNSYQFKMSPVHYWKCEQQKYKLQNNKKKKKEKKLQNKFIRSSNLFQLLISLMAKWPIILSPSSCCSLSFLPPHSFIFIYFLTLPLSSSCNKTNAIGNDSYRSERAVDGRWTARLKCLNLILFWFLTLTLLRCLFPRRGFTDCTMDHYGIKAKFLMHFDENESLLLACSKSNQSIHEWRKYTIWTVFSLSTWTIRSDDAWMIDNILSRTIRLSQLRVQIVDWIESTLVSAVFGVINFQISYVWLHWLGEKWIN